MLWGETMVNSWSDEYVIHVKQTQPWNRNEHEKQTKSLPENQVVRAVDNIGENIIPIGKGTSIIENTNQNF